MTKTTGYRINIERDGRGYYMLIGATTGEGAKRKASRLLASDETITSVSGPHKIDVRTVAA
jgi:hypothetical protein